MPRHTAVTKRARSSLQKARSRSLVQQRWKVEADDTVNDNCIADHGLCPTPVDVSGVTIQYNDDMSTPEVSKPSYKSVIQRERRAQMKITELKTELENAYKQALVVHEAQTRTELVIKALRASAEASAQNVCSLEQQVLNVSEKLSSALRSLALEKRLNRALSNQKRAKIRAYNTLLKRIKRRQGRRTQAMTPTQIQPSCFALKDKSGTVRSTVRDMLRKLVCEGIPTGRVYQTIKIVADCLGVEIVGSVSTRSISRAMLEGLVQSNMQIAHELQRANYVSICGDGTTIKNLQHESKAIYLQGGPSDSIDNMCSPVIRTLGVQKSVNHTAQEQFNGWMNTLDTCCSTLNRSPLGQGARFSKEQVALKLRGVLTDHAANQKRLLELIRQWKQNCDRQVRALPILKEMSTEQQLYMLSQYLDDAADLIPGWRLLPGDQQSTLMHDAWLALANQIGEREFQKLEKSAQFEADFIAWTGCCMHKELNAVKGGVGAMAKAWSSLGTDKPILLKNKFETNDALGVGGAVKLTSLAGALFNNKDDKRGYQSTIDFYFERVFGYSKRFPDTSNTRYGSHCDAASELIIHLDVYTELLELLRDAKNTASFTNIEQNIFDALQDTPTLTELVVLSLYAQSIGRPYMRHVRSGAYNAVDLGAFHSLVKQHCQAVIKNPELLLALDVSATTGTLDGKAWDRPEVVYSALALANRLPHIRTILVAFFEGALKAWERFTTEFEADGVIAQATVDQRQSVRISPTNDISEGSLGRCRQILRRAPTMTDNQRNARVMWKQNSTQRWAEETLTKEDDAFVRQEARDIDASGSSRKVRIALSLALEQKAEASRARRAKAEAKKASTKAKLAKINIINDATYEELSNLTVQELNSQIDKLREADNGMPAKSKLRTKVAKINEILAGLQRRKDRIILVDLKSNAETQTFEKDMAMADGMETDEGFPNDEDMCFDDEVIL